MISFDVIGQPAPQGSKKAYVNKYTGRANLVESSKGVGPWREAVKAAVFVQRIPRTPGPVFVSIIARFARPTSHYGTGRNADRLKPSAPAYPIGKNRGDVDKLARSTNDGLADAGVIDDDKFIVRTVIEKRWCRPGELPGADIHIAPMTATDTAA